VKASFFLVNAERRGTVLNTFEGGAKMIKAKPEQDNYWRLDLSFDLSQRNGIFEANDLSESRGWWYSKDGTEGSWKLQQSSDQLSKGITDGDFVQFRFRNRGSQTEDVEVQYYITFGRDRKHDSVVKKASPFELKHGGARCVLTGKAEREKDEPCWVAGDSPRDSGSFFEIAIGAGDEVREAFEFVVAIEVTYGDRETRQYGYDPTWCVGKNCG
jgi:hypothetical protein